MGLCLFVTIVFTGVFGTHLNIVVAAVLVCLLVVKIVVRHEEIAPAVVIYVHVVVNKSASVYNIGAWRHVAMETQKLYGSVVIDKVRSGERIGQPAHSVGGIYADAHVVVPEQAPLPGALQPKPSAL